MAERESDAGQTLLGLAAVATCGPLLVLDQYAELLAAGVAYAASWPIVLRASRAEEEQTP